MVVAFATTSLARHQHQATEAWRSHIRRHNAAQGSLRAGKISTAPAKRSVGRTLAMWSIATMAAGSVPGIGLMVYGYVAHPGTFWLQRLEERRQSPIFSPDGQLIGSLDTRNLISQEQARNMAYLALQPELASSLANVPTPAPLPTVWKQAILYAENRHFESGGLRNLCGLDVLAAPKRWIGSGATAGGSGLSQQLARQLKHPEWGSEKTLLDKATRKLLEIGASCRMYQALQAQGGRDEVLRAYANYAPVMQGNGTLRGLEAGARILFGVSPYKLNPAQQILLAAAVKTPLRIDSAVDDAGRTACSHLYPTSGNPHYDPDAAQNVRQRPRTNQCRVLYRARWIASNILEGEQLREAQAVFDALEQEGIKPVNPFGTIAASRLINLSTRSQATLTPTMLAELKRQVEREQAQPGAPVTLAISPDEQRAFQRTMDENMRRIDKHRTPLCLPLSLVDAHSGNSPTPKRAPFRPARACPLNDKSQQQALTLAMRVNVRTGHLHRYQSSLPNLAHTSMALGSLAKWIIGLAAVEAGLGPQTMICPRAASDGGRVLHRVTPPETGYARCEDRQLISLAHAMATSDNLAFFELAQHLGEPKLRQAVQSLDLGMAQESAPQNAGTLAYQLAFGTFEASPLAWLRASQALVTLAWEMDMQQPAGTLLQTQHVASQASLRTLERMLPNVEQREALKTLLSAPAQEPDGTVARLGLGLDAGKTGTTQSDLRDREGHRLIHAKWLLLWQADQQALSLLVVTSPGAAYPLAPRQLGLEALKPLVSPLVARGLALTNDPR